MLGVGVFWLIVATRAGLWYNRWAAGKRCKLVRDQRTAAEGAPDHGSGASNSPLHAAGRDAAEWHLCTELDFGAGSFTGEGLYLKIEATSGGGYRLAGGFWAGGDGVPYEIYLPVVLRGTG